MVRTWETIRNLISEKSRDLRQRGHRVVEEDDHDHPPSNPDVPLAVPAPSGIDTHGV
jgi:hypothetical protein